MIALPMNVSLEGSRSMGKIWEKMNVMLLRDDRTPVKKMWIFATVHVVAIDVLFVPTRGASTYLEGIYVTLPTPVSLPETQSFIQAATRPPPKRAAKRRPDDPMGKYETMYQSKQTSCAMAAIKVRMVLCN